eukprot:CAMPEP_0170489582 /NCGR_PEP_ID=MMETSP0208-20121228/7916_1 /TAXON_ID=197538 /ORGANISM="Strombidium inclinatum, Strain S3" /LENGTH=62 /DNA_ID=CAMNT_0010764569 /DNA_START=1735 /DNA_END=1923 /DNA_ORIENTATION=-
MRTEMGINDDAFSESEFSPSQQEKYFAFRRRNGGMDFSSTPNDPIQKNSTLDHPSEQFEIET